MDGVTLTQQTQEKDGAQVASEAARAFMQQAHDQSQAPPPEVAPEVVATPEPQAAVEDPSANWIVKAQYEEAQRKLLEQRLGNAIEGEEAHTYRLLLQDLQAHPELREALETFYKKKRGEVVPTASSPAPSPEGQPPAASVDPRLVEVLRRHDAIAKQTHAVQNKMAEDMYRDLLDRQCERLVQKDPAFNKQQAALAAREYGIEIKDFDKAWEVAKDPFLGVVMKQYQLGVDSFEQVRSLANGIRNQQAVQQQVPPQYQQQYAPQQNFQVPPGYVLVPQGYAPVQTQTSTPVQAAPVVRVPAPSAPISTRPEPFTPRPNMPGSHVTQAATAAWANGTLHN